MKLLDRRFFNFSLSVQGIAAQPAANPTAGTQYIVADNPTGAFAIALPNQIARYDGSAWSFTSPSAGSLEVLNLDSGEFLQFDGSAWIVVASLNNSSSDSSDSSSGNRPITIVDDIIYGCNDSSHTLSPTTLNELRGRPFLINSGQEFYLAVNNILSSGTLEDIYSFILDDFLNSSAVYAGFADAKIHSITGSGQYNLQYSSTDILDGDFIFNKADNSLYCYDANNSRFIKLGGHHSYVVDVLVDYIGNSLPESLNSGDAFVFDTTYNGGGVPSLAYFLNGEKKFHFAPSTGFSFANINSILSDEPAIYSTQYDSTEEFSIVHVIHDLYDGDTIFNKADGCTYILSVSGDSKSFVRITSPVFSPVQDILHIGYCYIDNIDTPSNNDDKCISWYDYTVSYVTANGSGGWSSHRMNSNQYGRYISLDDFKIYSFFAGGGSATGFIQSDIPIGGTFLNKADNSLYIFDGTALIKVGGNSSSDSLTLATEAHSLTAAEVTAKGFTLSHNIASGQEGNTLLFVSGIAQTVGVDFSASGNSITWNNKALDDIPLIAGDSLLIQYIYE